MSSAVPNPDPVPEPAHQYIVRRTVEACRLAKEAAGAAAEGIATVLQRIALVVATA
jgi:hypothetical protein